MYVIGMKRYLQHYGVKGMRWGVRKKGSSGPNYRTSGLTIKKGTSISRVSTVAKERHKGSGYASVLKKDSEGYRKRAAFFSKLGSKHFDLSFKTSKDLISPSKKTRIDTFLKKLGDPKFNKRLKETQRRMFIFNITNIGDVKMALKNEKLSVKKAKAYRVLNLALGIGGDKKLKAAYLNEFKKLGYDFILDEADTSSGLAKSPIIIIDRKDSLEFVKSEAL